MSASIPVISFRIEQTPYSDSLSYYLTTCQWVDGTHGPKASTFKEVGEAILRILHLLPDEIGHRADQALERMSEDPYVAEIVLNALRKDHVGTWCVARKRKEFGDYWLICKMCGGEETMEPGLTPPRCCGACGLEHDPGPLPRWFEFVDTPASEYWTGYEPKPVTEIRIRCSSCRTEMTYSFRTGPPLRCPRCVVPH